MKTVQLLEQHPDGTQVHLMDAGFQRRYGTDKAAVIPTLSADAVPLYQSLAAIPPNLPNGQQVSLAIQNFGVPVQGANVIHGIYNPDGSQVHVPTIVQPQVAPIGLIGLIAAIVEESVLAAVLILGIIAITATLVVFMVTGVAIKAFSPRCDRTVSKLTELNNNHALVETPDCGVVTLDKNTGQVVDTVAKPPASIPETLIYGAVGLLALYLIATFLTKRASSTGG